MMLPRDKADRNNICSTYLNIVIYLCITHIKTLSNIILNDISNLKFAPNWPNYYSVGVADFEVKLILQISPGAKLIWILNNDLSTGKIIFLTS